MGGAPGTEAEDNGAADGGGGGTVDGAGAPHEAGSSLGRAAMSPVLSSPSAV